MEFETRERLSITSSLAQILRGFFKFLITN